MTRNSFKRMVVGLAASALAFQPVAAFAQKCADDGSPDTRGADVEYSWAQRNDDPQSKPERYNRMLEKLVPAFEEDPPLSRAYLLAATAYFGLRDYAAADTMLDRLVVMDAACGEISEQMRFDAWVNLYNRAITKVTEGSEDEALEAFNMANVIYEDARSLNNSASIYQSREEYDPAIELYRRAIVAGGEADMIRVASINLAELLRMRGETEEALRIYEEYAGAHPDDVLGTLNYAIALMDDGDVEGAQGIFADLMQRDDLSFRQWTQVGIGLYRADNYDAAREAFSKAHTMHPWNKEVLVNLANAEYYGEKFDVLAFRADTLISRYPYEVVNYNLQANAYRELDRSDEALAVLERRDALPFEIISSQLVPQGDNAYMVEIQALNRTLPPGSEVSIPLVLHGETGQALKVDRLVFTMPEQSEGASFQVQLESEDPVAGFSYGLAAEAGS